MLMVQGTRDGKSAVPQTVGTVFGGVILVIENTLSLGKYFCVLRTIHFEVIITYLMWFFFLFRC